MNERFYATAYSTQLVPELWKFAGRNRLT